MAPKLTPRQQAQLAWLTTVPPRLEKLNRLIEQMATMQADDASIRAGARLLDEMKAQASGLSITALSDTFGYMGTLLRRSGGQQVRVRGLREMLAGAKINLEGALRSASTPEPGAEDDRVSPS
ncbi:MAG TPA: hypothetical protein VFN90_03125 [Gemmatimonadales bacterium]|nr:hypothetical protein [Gemmatimonadales bacterium]